MKPISDLAKNQHEAELALEAAKRERAEQARKKWVPIIALVVANLIFISLDIRAFDVVWKLTNSGLLAVATVIVSGVLALFWWDVLYPHSRRHDNKTQINLSIGGVGIGILMSLVLAFLDYIVGTAAINQGWLWAAVVLATGGQGVMLGWWWLVDTAIDADAKRQKSLAGRIDLQDSVSDLKAEIDSMISISAKLAEIQKTFPRKGEAEKAARAMGYPVLAQMLADDDGDGTPNFRDPDYRPNRPQQNATRQAQMAPAMSDTEKVELKATNPPAGSGSK